MIFEASEIRAEGSESRSFGDFSPKLEGSYVYRTEGIPSFEIRDSVARRACSVELKKQVFPKLYSPTGLNSTLEMEGKQEAGGASSFLLWGLDPLPTSGLGVICFFFGMAKLINSPILPIMVKRKK